LKKAINFWVLLIFTVLLSGCASTVYFKTEQDPTAKIIKHKSFRVLLNDPTIENKKFMILLNQELLEQGFKVSNDSSFDYAIVFYLDKKSYNGVNSYTSNKHSTSYTRGFVGNSYVSTTTTSSVPVTHTYSYTYSYKKIYVEIVDTTKGNKDNFPTVWTGFMSIDDEDYEKNRIYMITKLVELIGKEFKGYIEIDSSK